MPERALFHVAFLQMHIRIKSQFPHLVIVASEKFGMKKKLQNNLISQLYYQFAPQPLPSVVYPGPSGHIFLY